MRTRGHRERSITHQGLLRGANGGTMGGQGGRGERTWEEMPDVGYGGMEAANHIDMCVHMQLSCMFCTCTPKPKMQ